MLLPEPVPMIVRSKCASLLTWAAPFRWSGSSAPLVPHAATSTERFRRCCAAVAFAGPQIAQQPEVEFTVSRRTRRCQRQEHIVLGVDDGRDGGVRATHAAGPAGDLAHIEHGVTVLDGIRFGLLRHRMV